MENLYIICSNYKKMALLMSNKVVFKTKSVQNQRGTFHYD